MCCAADGGFSAQPLETAAELHRFEAPLHGMTVDWLGRHPYALLNGKGYLYTSWLFRVPFLLDHVCNVYALSGGFHACGHATSNEVLCIAA